MENEIHGKRITERRKLTTNMLQAALKFKSNSTTCRFENILNHCLLQVSSMSRKEMKSNLRPKLIGHFHFVELLTNEIGNLGDCCKQAKERKNSFVSIRAEKETEQQCRKTWTQRQMKHSHRTSPAILQQEKSKKLSLTAWLFLFRWLGTTSSE